MKTTLFSGICCVAIAAMTCVSAQADIVCFDFNDPADIGTVISGSTGSQRVTYASTLVDPNATSTDFAGVGAQIFSNGGLNTAFFSTAGSAAQGAAAGDSATFTATAAPGFELALTDLIFDASTGQTATQFSVDVVADGGASVNVLAAGNNVGTGQTIDLSSFAGATSLEVTYNFTTFNGGNLQIDNVKLDGAVVAAVPEPSSLAILGLAGIAACVRRRR